VLRASIVAADAERLSIGADVAVDETGLERGETVSRSSGDPARGQLEQLVGRATEHGLRGVVAAIRQLRIVHSIAVRAGLAAFECDRARVETEIFDLPPRAIRITRVAAGARGHDIATFLVVASGVAEARRVIAHV
jgi:hypothetical protein